MEKSEALRLLEGLLFLAGNEGITASQLASVLETEVDVIHDWMQALMTLFDEQKRGLQVVRVAGHYQLTTRAEHVPYFEKFAYVPEQQTLSKAALETVSIVAYKQPITRVEIEEIRGVKSDRSLQTLVQRQLIEEIGRAEQIGRPILYGTTQTFLTYFGLDSLADLPDLPEYNEEEELNLTQSLFNGQDREWVDSIQPNASE